MRFTAGPGSDAEELPWEGKDDQGDLPWHTSKRSGQDGECVEVAVLAKACGVRDSKNRGGGQLWFPREAWGIFIGAIRRGEFDYGQMSEVS